MSATHDALAAAIDVVVDGLPEGQALLLADRIVAASDPGSAYSALNAVANERYRAMARHLVGAWLEHPDVPAVALAIGLRAGVAAQARSNAAERVTPVWTGPTTPFVPVRRTQQVLLDLIGRAQHRLTIVSFAAYRVQVVVDAIADAVARGVDVRLLLETADAGVLDVDAADAFKAVRGSVGIYVWPIDQRQTAHGQPGNLHAKTVICDESAALVTSANLTGFAMEINMELGILVEGGPVPKRLAQHLNELMAHGVLRQLG